MKMEVGGTYRVPHPKHPTAIYKVIKLSNWGVFTSPGNPSDKEEGAWSDTYFMNNATKIEIVPCKCNCTDLKDIV